MATPSELLKNLDYLHPLNDEERDALSKIGKPLFLSKKNKIG